MRVVLLIMIISAIVGLGGCGSARIDNAERLASALKVRGVNYQRIEAITLPELHRVANVDEAIALTGQNLHVEIYRAESERAYGLLFTAVVLGGMIEQGTQDRRIEGHQVRTQAYRKQPFIILVKEEPQSGIVKEALETIFPLDE